MDRTDSNGRVEHRNPHNGTGSPRTVHPSAVELVTIKAADPDLVLQHLLTAPRIEFQREEPSGKLLLESLGNAASLYLAQRYGSSPLRLPVYRQGLSRERTLRLVDFIEAHLETNLSVLELSEVACLSPYHCGRIFKRSMGCSLHQYVTTRRIERGRTVTGDFPIGFHLKWLSGTPSSRRTSRTLAREDVPQNSRSDRPRWLMPDQ